MIDVAAKDFKIIQTILSTHVPHCEVRAFGSRVHHTAKPYSDLDLAVVGGSQLPDCQFHALKEAFEESDLPFRVDVMDWNVLSNDFQKVISKEFVVIQTKAPVS
jgi:predicted nucleotidyltransferase